MKSKRIAVDIGGTFVDAVEFDSKTSEIRFKKALTTPHRPAEGVFNALRSLDTQIDDVDIFIHGTTLGLNSVLEKRGARTGILSNKGFRDIFLIGRGNVPASRMYDFQYERPQSIVARRDTFEITGRMDYRGNIVVDLDESELDSISDAIVNQGVESLAVCFLHAHVNPAHEKKVAELIQRRHPKLPVSISSNIAREYREYERTSTTVIEAYIRPIFEKYIDELEGGLSDIGFHGKFLIMRSGGGSMTSEMAKLSPTHTVLSGPAGGIVGGTYVARELNLPHLLTFDVGGTSVDACVIENGSPANSFESELENYPLLIPTYDIRTIGAGGGSVAWLDRDILKVGPQSAGADPGPVCYGRGGKNVTLTDAALILGFMDPERFLSGEMKLDEEAAQSILLETIAKPLALGVDAAAAGIVDVLLARMIAAIRQITVERGFDPRQFALLAFGGAGPLLGPILAREMEMQEVIIPLVPSGFSAWGMLSADIENNFSRTLTADLEIESHSLFEEIFYDLEVIALDSLLKQEIPNKNAIVERSMDLRYVGQEHTLSVTIGEEFDIEEAENAFNQLHRARYGHAMDSKIQALNLRVKGIGHLSSPKIQTFTDGDHKIERALIGERNCFDFATRKRMSYKIYDRSNLMPGDLIDGPALVDEGTSVTVIPSDCKCSVDSRKYLSVRKG